MRQAIIPIAGLWAITLLASPAIHATPFGGGTGEPNAPYQIWTADQMNAIGADPNLWDKHFILMADIDLSAYTGTQFNIIGYYHSWQDKTCFQGVFDGNGYSIYHFTYTSSSYTDYVGLFGYVIRGQIRNLRLVAPNVNVSGGPARSASEFIGALAGYANVATIADCAVEGGTVAGGTQVGGLAGLFLGDMSNCSSTAYVSGASNVGGLVGRNEGAIVGCHARGSVSGLSTVGGLIGYSRGAGTVTQSWAQSDVQSMSLAGGLVGSNEGDIEGCFSDSLVCGSATCGGLVGLNTGKVLSCYAQGAVVGEDIESELRAVDEDLIGGLLGRNDGDVFYCYSTTSLSGDVTIGGLVGLCPDGSVQASYWDTETSGTAVSAGGTARSTVQMKRTDTFRGWHSLPWWTLDEEQDYPRLVWEERATAPIANTEVRCTQGSGVSDDPYQVWTAQEFVSLGYCREDWDKCFILMANLDLSQLGPHEFVPIGDAYTAFSGVFDGAGHSIDGFTCDLEYQPCVGVFGLLVAPEPDPCGIIAVVRDLHLINAQVFGRDYVGGLVGCNRGTITGCSVAGDVVGVSQVGGVVGINYGELNRCFSTGMVVAASDGVGGLVGENSSIPSNIIGPLLSGNGWARISESFSSAQVSGETTVGGIAGCGNGTIVNSYATGTVSGEHDVGGLIAYAYGMGTVATCYSTSTVMAGESGGGLVGSSYYGKITASFWDIEVSGQSTSAGGTGLTTAQMQTAGTFLDAGWDFIGESDNGTEGIWWMSENDYPRLWWELAEDSGL